jgi:hypothetical protein
MDTLWLSVAALTCLTGFAWLALAMDVHWTQVRDTPVHERPVRTLRLLGGVSLLLSLMACLQADQPGMALLVWVMLLAASAKSVALALAWKPSWLRPLVSWVV